MRRKEGFLEADSCVLESQFFALATTILSQRFGWLYILLCMDETRGLNNPDPALCHAHMTALTA
jgi:hypothetical protein